MPVGRQVRPTEPTTAARCLRLGAVDRQGATYFLGPLIQIRQAAAGDVFRHAPAVVNNFDEQVIFRLDGDSECCGVGVPRGVADRFAHNGFSVIGEDGANHRQWSDELRRNTYFPVRELGDRFVKSPSQPGHARGWPMEVEDRRPDFLDHRLKIVDVLR